MDGLNLGQVMTKTVIVTVTDTDRGSAAQTLTIIITGANDAPRLQAITAEDAVVAEAGGITDAAGDRLASGTCSAFPTPTPSMTPRPCGRTGISTSACVTRTGSAMVPETGWSAGSRGDGDGDGAADDAVTTLTTSAVTAAESTAAGGVHAGRDAGTLYRSWDVGAWHGPHL